MREWLRLTHECLILIDTTSNTRKLTLQSPESRWILSQIGGAFRMGTRPATRVSVTDITTTATMHVRYIPRPRPQTQAQPNQTRLQSVHTSTNQGKCSIINKLETMSLWFNQDNNNNNHDDDDRDYSPNTNGPVPSIPGLGALGVSCLWLRTDMVLIDARLAGWLVVRWWWCWPARNCIVVKTVITYERAMNQYCRSSSPLLLSSLTMSRCHSPTTRHPQRHICQAILLGQFEWQGHYSPRANQHPPTQCCQSQTVTVILRPFYPL